MTERSMDLTAFDFKADGPERQRDQLAVAIMFKALDRDWSLWRDPQFLAAQSYKIADAMKKARGHD